MITTEEWNQAFEHIVPTVSLGVATLSVVLGVMALTRSGPLGRRAYQLDGQYLVSVRYPGQWHDLRSFVQPNTPDVLATLSQIDPGIWACFDFVCRHVAYKSEVGEMWQFPSETLARGQGDCEDSAFLFVSLAQNFAPDVWAILGDYQGFGHAWGAQRHLIYETTYTSARQVADPQNYRALVAFNHYEFREAYPGALREMFALRRNEESKLELMAKALEVV